MKRSEAKLEIFYVLEKQYSHPETNSKIAEEILTSLEKTGMLPPRTKLGTLGIEDNAWEEETCSSCSEPCGNDWCCLK